MCAAFSASAEAIGTLLTGPHQICAPPYQRDYCWTKKEAGQLLDDLWMFLSDATGRGTPRGYFLGSLVFVERPANGHAVPLRDIVDGKQRLVTLTILLAVLRDIIGEKEPWIAQLLAMRPANGREGEPRLQLGADETAYFTSHILQPGGTLHSGADGELSPGEECMRDNREYILEDIDRRDTEQLRALARLIRDQVEVAVISTGDVDMAYRIFTVTNDRGKPLDGDDILKAELTADIPSPEREAYVMRWDAAKRELGNHFASLFSHIRTVHGGGHSTIVQDIVSIARRSGGEAAFIDQTVLPLADMLGNILNARAGAHPQAAEISARLTYLSWHKSADWIPPLLLYMMRSKDHPERLPAFLTELDRISYGLAMLGIGNEKRETRYRNLMQTIRAGRLDNPASLPDLLSADDQRNMLHNVTHDLHNRSQQVCKLILLRLDSAFSGAAPRQKPEDCSVEHVLPRRPGDASQWRRWFPNADERELCTNCLGNLVLVTDAQNRKARNLPFDEKLQIYFPEAKSSGFALTDQLRGMTQWTPREVRSRDALLMERLCKLWRIKLAGARASVAG